MRFYARLILSLLLLATVVNTAGAQDTPSSDFTAKADRYWKILATRPRKGTAFDQAWQLHRDVDRIDAFARRAQQHASTHPQDAAAHVLLGLIHERLAENEKALTAWNAAAELDPNDYYPHALRGDLLARLSRRGQAAVAWQQAIARKPPRTELLTLFKQLGRLQLQQGLQAEAFKTFTDLRAAFPKDVRVLTELAELLEGEREYGMALSRWKQVRDLSEPNTDARLAAELSIAGIHAARGELKSAVDNYARLLDRLKPDGWSARDIRARIQTAFLNSGDAAGLLAFWKARSESHPDDIDSRLELARALTRSDRTEEAADAYRAILEVAPSRRDVREALIQQLARAKNFQAAIAQSEILANAFPRDADILRAWGQLHLDRVAGKSHDSPQLYEAQEKAAEIWSRIADIRPTDAIMAVQAADACRQGAGVDVSGMTDSSDFLRQRYRNMPLAVRAEALYRKAVERGTPSREYNEFLGQFLYGIGRGEEAADTWMLIATHDAATAADWRRVARLLDQYRFPGRAIMAGERAIALDPENTALREFQIGLLRADKEVDHLAAILKQADELLRLAASDDARAKAIHLRTESLTEGNLTGVELKRIADRLKEAKLADAEQVNLLWLRSLLWQSQEANSAAAAEFKKAVSLEPENVPLVRDYAEFLINVNLYDAIAQFNRLVELEPTRRETHLERIVVASIDKGDRGTATEQAERLFRFPPFTVDDCLRRARLARRLKQPTREVEFLRQAVQRDPRQLETRRELASVLSRRKQFEEAVEQLWRVFEMSDDLKAKLDAVTALTLTAEKVRRTAQIEARLESDRDQRPRDVSVALCLAKSLSVTGKSTRAIAEVDRILQKHPSNKSALHFRIELAANSGDWEAAAMTRERLAEFDTNPATLKGIILDYQNAGKLEEATNAATRLFTQFGDGTGYDALIRHLLDQRHLSNRYRLEQSLRIARQARDQQVDDWKNHWRVGCLSWALEDTRPAIDSFAQVARLCINARAQTPATSARTSTSQTTVPSITIGTKSVYQVRATGAVVFARRKPDEPYSLPLLNGLKTFDDFTATSTMLQEMSRFGASEKRKGILSPLIALPPSDYEARLSSTVALSVLDAPEKLRFANPADRRFHLLIDAVQGRSLANWESLDAFANSHADDPLPHLAKLYGSSRDLDDLVPKDREAVVQSLADSFAWLEQNHPQADELIYNYAAQLISLGEGKAAADAIANRIDRVPLNSIGAILQLSTPIRSAVDEQTAPNADFGLPDLTHVRNAALRRAVELVASETTLPPELAPVLTHILIEHTLTGFSDEELRHVFELCVRRKGPLYQFNAAPQSYFRRVRDTLGDMLRSIATAVHHEAEVIETLGPLTDTSMRQIHEAHKARQIRLETLLHTHSQINQMGFMLPGAQPSIRFPVLPLQLWHAHEMHLLEQLTLACSEVDRGDTLLAWIEASAASPLSAPTHWKLAKSYVHWWLDDRESSVRVLDELAVANDHKAIGIEIALALGLYANEQIGRCYAMLSEIETQLAGRPAVALWNPQFTSRPAPILEVYKFQSGLLKPRVHRAMYLLDDNQQHFNCLIALLQQPKPDLAIFFKPAAKSDLTAPEKNRARSPTNVRQSFSAPAIDLLKVDNRFDSPRSRVTFESRVILPGVLDFAATNGSHDTRLVALAQHTSDALDRNSNSTELIALQTLVAARQGNLPLAKSSLRSWEDRAKRYSVQMPTLAHGLLDHPQLASEGARLAARFLVRGTSDPFQRQAIMRKVSAVLADESRRDLAEAMVTHLFDEVESGGIGELPELCELFPSMNPELAAVSIHRGSKVIATYARYLGRDRGTIGRNVYAAVMNSHASWNMEQCERISESLMSMLFPQGAAGQCELYEWNQEQNDGGAHGNLGKALWAIADKTILLQLRQQCDNHPLKDSAPIVALRAEAALALGDTTMAKELLEAHEESKTDSDTPVPIWSSQLRPVSWPDKSVATRVLELGGKVWIEPGGRCYSASQFPDHRFHVVRIAITGDGVRDPKLRQLSGSRSLTGSDWRAISLLKHLEELSLRSLPIKDSELAWQTELASLHTINLDNTLVTASGILKKVKDLPNLRHLSLRKTSMNSSDVSTIRQHLPNCRITFEQ